MKPTPRERIATISDEVRELHPLLEVLLSRMPGIDSVENTHGQRENGADFVCAHRHPNLGTNEYIGVIAKKGKLHQDLSSVERQIEECKLIARPADGGKRRIYLDEIWVISTDTITPSGKEKIQQKYRATKIHFIDGAKLAQLVDEHFPAFWTNANAAVADYMIRLRTATDDLDRRFSLLTAVDHQYYIPQHIAQAESQPYAERKLRRRKREKHAIVNEIKKHRVLLVEAGMGAGKSKLMRHLVKHYTDSDIFLEEQIVPIPASFKELLDDHAGDPANLLATRISDDVRRELGEGATFLFLIDAIDETHLPPEETRTAVEAIAQQVHSMPNSRAVLTTRELIALRNYAPLNNTVSRYELLPLSMSQVLDVLKELCERLNIHTRILEDVKKSALFRELPRNPIAALLLAQLLTEISTDLPSNLTELYTKYVELALGRWDIEKGLQSMKEYDALDNILVRLSRYMLDNELQVIGSGEAKQVFATYLRERNLGLDADDLYEWAVDRTELLVLDGRAATVAFKHRTFAEYLYARGLVRDGIFRISTDAFDMYWANVFFFGFGLKRDAPVLLSELIELAPQSEDEKLVKLLNVANYCLAAYMTPYDVITSCVKDTLLEAASCFQDIAEGKSALPLVHLPKMHLLFLFQTLLRHSYGFRFFKRALEDAALDLKTSDRDDESRLPYALFFMNVSYIELGDGATFDLLLDGYAAPLPIDLSLAIGYESVTIPKTHLMRKQEKRLRRILEANPALRDAVQRMHERPIKPLPQRKAIAGGVE